MNIAIIGGGASALFCALNTQKTHKVTIFCNEDKLGKKILVTGNGRCNITNAQVYEDSYNVNIGSYLSRFNQEQTLSCFNSWGLEFYKDEEGRFYPISNTATSVVDILAREIENNKNIQIKLTTKVEQIHKKVNKFVINNEFEFDKVVVCTGSVAEILDCLNIKHKRFIPSLMALKTKQNTKRLSGQKLSNVKVTLKFNGIEKTQNGEVLFKDNGLSGICIFNLSAFLARRDNFNAKISIDLLPQLTIEQVKKMLQKRMSIPLRNMGEFMQGLFHKEVNRYMLNLLKIDENQPINAQNIEKLAQIIKNLEFDIVSYYENNQVKSGGVCLEDLDKNLQSKQYKNLYFAGEVCNVDGLCGGYNLQWAWTSAKIVGDNL